MNAIESIYKKVVEVTCEICSVDPIMMFSSNKEKYVDARSLVIINLSVKGYTDSSISEMTGLTRQAINHIKNSFPDKFNRSWHLIYCQQQISNKLSTDLQ